MNKIMKPILSGVIISTLTSIPIFAATSQTAGPTLEKKTAPAPATPVVVPATPVVAPATPVVAPATPVAAPAAAAPAPTVGTVPVTKSTASPTTPGSAVTTGVKAATTPVSVLERFRAYTGSRTPAALSELFSGPVFSGVSQQPEVVLSNGAASVVVTAELPASIAKAPAFAATGGILLSQSEIGKGVWLIEFLPEAETMKADLAILSNGVTLKIPLTIAPPLPQGTDLSDTAFNVFLGTLGKEGGAKASRDLNGDGRQDYIDDYIFAANYLINKRTTVTSTQPSVTEDPTGGRPVEQTQQSTAQSTQQESGTAQQASGTGDGVGATPAAFGGGWAAPAGAPSNGNNPPVGGGTSPPPSDNGTPNTPPGGGTPNPPPGGGGTNPIGTYKIEKDGISLTYQGTANPGRLNMRNLNGKYQKNNIK